MWNNIWGMEGKHRKELLVESDKTMRDCRKNMLVHTFDENHIVILPLGV
jgi:hypothetical protein